MNVVSALLDGAKTLASDHGTHALPALRGQGIERTAFVVVGARAVVPGALALVSTRGEFVAHMPTNSPFVPAAPRPSERQPEGSHKRGDRRHPSLVDDAVGAARRRRQRLDRRQRAGEAERRVRRQRPARAISRAGAFTAGGRAAGAIDLQHVDPAGHVEAVDDLVRLGSLGAKYAAQNSPWLT